MISLNDNVIKCMGALVNHLKEFCLDKILKLSQENFQQFLKTDVMHLNGITINNLELFANQTNGSIHSSLWWVLDKTSTSFGRRLLKTWVGQPLTSAEKIKERQDAVEEIRDRMMVQGNHDDFFDKFDKLCKGK